jgi:hypothetical protein
MKEGSGSLLPSIAKEKEEEEEYWRALNGSAKTKKKDNTNLHVNSVALVKKDLLSSSLAHLGSLEYSSVFDGGMGGFGKLSALLFGKKSRFEHSAMFGKEDALTANDTNIDLGSLFFSFLLHPLPCMFFYYPPFSFLLLLLFIY